jgi:hypothetical protein
MVRPVKANKTIHDVRVGAGRDRVGETAAAADFRRDDLSGHGEHERGEPLGNCNLLAGGAGEIPRMNQELDREDAQGRCGGHLAPAQLHGAIRAAGVPSLQRRLGRGGDAGLVGGRGGRGELGAGGAAHERYRPDQLPGAVPQRQLRNLRTIRLHKNIIERRFDSCQARRRVG